jgi:hypothetical protein
MARNLDAKSASVLTWIDKSLVSTVNLYSSTAQLCDASKGHTCTNLHLTSVYHLY